MKTKNVSLAILAFALAIGSAFASLLAPENVWAKGVFSEGAEFTCFNTGVQCDASGSSICQVQIPLQGGGSDVASSASTSTKKPYRGTNCVTVLANTSSTLLVSTIPQNQRPISIQ